MHDNEAFGHPLLPENLGLHYLALDIQRLPLWEFDTVESFSRCLKDIISGFQFLGTHNIVHRNISARSFFISQDSSGSFHGFITDFDHTERTYNVARTSGGTNPLVAGAAQFMAMEILNDLIQNQRTTVVFQAARHDQESFLWVCIYALYVRTIQKAKAISTSEPELISEEFKDIFAAANFDAIYRKRRALIPYDFKISDITDTQALLAGMRTYEPILRRFFSLFIGIIHKQQIADKGPVLEDDLVHPYAALMAPNVNTGIDLIEMCTLIDKIMVENRA